MDALERFVADELSGGALPPACAVTEVQRRLGSTLAAVLFYGACRRNPEDTADGIVDLWALVDEYRATYESRFLAGANALLPPNVFHLQLDDGDRTVRAKLAVISMRDFAQGARGEQWRPQVWARFCQPASLAWVRDETSRVEVVRAIADTVRAAVGRGLALWPVAASRRRFTTAELRQTLLRETYASELRTEAPEAIDALFDAAPARYRLALGLVLAERQHAGQGAFLEHAGVFETFETPGASVRPARLRRTRRALARALQVLGLLKAVLTFGDWLPYVLGKLERHTGTRLEPSARQRRHPLLFGWPLVWRALRSGNLH